MVLHRRVSVKPSVKRQLFCARHRNEGNEGDLEDAVAGLVAAVDLGVGLVVAAAAALPAAVALVVAAADLPAEWDGAVHPCHRLRDTVPPVNMVLHDEDRVEYITFW